MVGGGPAGLYFSILIKKSNPKSAVRVFERNPRGATYGWGVVFSDGSLGKLERADPMSHTALMGACAGWDPIEVRRDGNVTRVRGNGFSGIGRHRLLDVLVERAQELGVDLLFETDLANVDELLDADLVVGADGANSTVRRAFEARFRPRIDLAPARYAWFGSDFAFPVFTYIFRRTDWGTFQAHCYPYSNDRSTVVVMVSDETWRRAHLDEMSEDDSVRFCEQVFRAELHGGRMLPNRSQWLEFPWITCRTWHYDNVVLVGDAAHTAHWSIGSGTRLAMEDAIALAEALTVRFSGLPAALVTFEGQRKPVVEQLQEASRSSFEYFSSIDHHWSLSPLRFAYHLMTRTPQVGHANLALRDATFVQAVEAEVQSESTGRRIDLSQPPSFAPLSVRGVRLTNRILASSAEHASGAAVQITPFHAVADAGRISPNTPLIPGPARDVDDVVTCLQLGHAGSRASVRCYTEGVDLPLREGAWPVFSASALPYAPWSAIPDEISRDGMDAVRRQFTEGAMRASDLGYRMIMLNFAHGHLLASFISPLTNRRTDHYGGSAANRLRFPLEVLDEVRGAIPEWLPLMVAFCVTDCARGGIEQTEAVDAARAFARHGADIVMPFAGQTVWEARPSYGPMYGARLADWIKWGASVITAAAGRIDQVADVNTIVASGRSDLCLLQPPRPVGSRRPSAVP